MKKLIVLVGAQGSGKTTYCEKNLTDYYRISQDEMGKKEHLERFFSALDREEPRIVIDRMGFSKEQRARYILPARDRGYTIKIVHFDTCQSVCLRRALARKDHPNINETNAEQAIGFYFKNFEPIEKVEYDELEIHEWR